MTESRVLRKNPSLLETEMDDQLFMLDMDQNSFFALNTVGAHIWNELDSQKTQGDLVASVLQAFDASDSKSVANDVEIFISQLIDECMVHVVED